MDVPQPLYQLDRVFSSHDEESVVHPLEQFQIEDGMPEFVSYFSFVGDGNDANDIAGDQPRRDANGNGADAHRSHAQNGIMSTSLQNIDLDSSGDSDSNDPRFAENDPSSSNPH